MNGDDPDILLSQSIDQAVQQNRSSRTNLLLSGTIEALDIKAPVRIRNLSETGALLEGAALPAIGHHLVLQRLQMEMGATVIWSANGRCGVRFDGLISVSGWREGNWITPVVSNEQARADSIQAAVRAGLLAATHEGTLTQAAPGSRDIHVRVAAELIVLKNILEKVSEQLSEDPAVLDLHGERLQDFDVACQALGRLADVLRAARASPPVD